jgi:hypothetical protein
MKVKCNCEYEKWEEGRRGMYTAMAKNQRMFKVIQDVVTILFLLSVAAAWIAMGV